MFYFIENQLFTLPRKHKQVPLFTDSQVFHLKITVDLMKMINSFVLGGENFAAEDALFSLTNTSD